MISLKCTLLTTAIIHNEISEQLSAICDYVEMFEGKLGVTQQLKLHRCLAFKDGHCRYCSCTALWLVQSILIWAGYP